MWQKAASSPYMDGLVVFSRLHLCASPSDTCFLDPSEPTTASRSVQLLLQGSQLWQTDQQTDWPRDHATASVTIGRIYVCSSAMRPNNNKHGVCTTHILCSIYSFIYNMYRGSCWLGIRRSIWPVKKFRCCCDYLSGARCKWFAYGSADATATLSSLTSLKSRLV